MEEIEKENEDKRSSDRSPSPAVKSTAVVKYTAFQSPVSYARLQCNTDLNLPPANYGTAIDSYGLKQILTGNSALSSFRMAHMFPDCVGEVDVIAGAECIKKLLKLPYQPNATISMMVHRVENTLLLDDFDVYDYLMKSEWSWLKDFFYENILKTMSEQERMSLALSPVSPSTRQLTHKFLSHSVAQHDKQRVAPHVTHAQRVAPHVAPPTLPLMKTAPGTIAGPFLPEPETKPSEPSEPPEHLYNRNVHWTFEDIHMLIGSDLPIFGDQDRPCVSLHLRDAREPINVLTGIDYWLDNLMCNVPEVLMCYHIDGIVQKYEPMKTEDLPNMENSNFSPKVIRNVAQNILSFLKSNVTKAGHTYWLFKGPHDDVVKLYDLTSLCPDKMDNPFTTPVAMLLYRVARNMRLTNRSKHVRQLLEHVVALLQVSEYPQIVASSHYMLADLYVPAATNPANPDFKDDSSDSEDDFDYPNETCDKDSNPWDAGDGESKSDEDGLRKDSKPETEVDSSEKNGKSEGQKYSKPETEGDSSEKDRKSEEEKESSEKDSKPETERDSNEKYGKSEREKDSELERDDAGNINEKDTKLSSEKEGGSDLVKCDGNALAVQVRGLTMRDIGDRKRESASCKCKGRRSGPGVTPPARCGRALTHARAGLQALHTLATNSCSEEERERLKQQIINEEQHPKMANPYEPIKMDYQPLNTEPKEHTSRSRRRKQRKISEKQPDTTIAEKEKTENLNIDKNAILIRNKKTFPSFNEPSRDDNFAWKLHLKTLLYEKICLAYATLAEYSYANEQYGFSLKYIDMASKCQKLLSNMILKSKVVDASCLLGRVGDNYFQLSKRWGSLDQYRKQFETDHDVDAKLKIEIETDMNEEVDHEVTDEFDLDISLPCNETMAMLAACGHYRRALAGGGRRRELLRRLASVTNELALKYMNNAQQLFVKYLEEPDEKDPKAKLLLKQFNSISKKSLESLDEAMEIFKEVNDQANLALLFCNKGRYLRFKAHCDQGGFSTEKRRLYNKAEELYIHALKILGPRESCGDATGIWDLVSWELSCHLYTKAVLMQDEPGQYALEVTEVAEALKHALKYCLLSPGPRQYLYQFRAAMVYHRLGSLYHSQYRRIKDEGPRRRQLFNATRANYEQASNMFAALEDASMFLTVQLEHVAVLEMQASIAPNLKLKSLQNAIQLLRQCHSVMKLIRNKDPEDVKKEKDKNKSEDTKNKSDDVKGKLDDVKDKPEDIRSKSEDANDKSIKSEQSLLQLYENRLHYILKNIIQYCRSKSNKDYEKMTEMYKKLYFASLKISKNIDVRPFAGSICDVLDNMNVISKEFEQ